MIKRIISSLLSIFGYQVKRIDKSLDKELGNWEWFKKYPISTIIDIGANEGQFASEILKIFPAAEIYCFEPLPGVFEKLKLNFIGHGNMHFHNIGLGEKEEEIEIFENEYSPSSSLMEMLDLHKKNFNFAVKSEPKIISLQRLDNFYSEIKKGSLLIKIDVQGYEMHVIRGGEEMIKQADLIIIETTFQRLYKGQPLFNDLYQYFTANGFYFAGNVQQLLSPVDKQILQADSVFIRSVN